MATIAHAGFLHETNTFAPLKTTWEDFVREESFPGLTEGTAILERFPSINIGTGGFINEAQEEFNRDKFVASNREALDATVDTWKSKLKANVHSAIDRWFDDARKGVILAKG